MLDEQGESVATGKMQTSFAALYGLGDELKKQGERVVGQEVPLTRRTGLEPRFSA